MFIGIVADDLTGAADVVAPFTRIGLTACVGLCLDADALESVGDWDVLSLNTELRDRMALKPTLISAVTRRATRRLKEHTPELYFKKIDSTLRGYLRAELDGMMRELHGRIALICPAFPENGRTVEQGIVFVHGVQLSMDNMPSGRVRTAFEMAEEFAASEIGLDTIRAGSQALAAACDRLIAAGKKFLFCDAVTPEDLNTLAELVMGQKSVYLAVGSAGFTRAIAARMSWPAKRSVPDWNENVFSSGRILVLVGSRHDNSRHQVERLTEITGFPPIHFGQAICADLSARLAQAFMDRHERGDRVFVLVETEGASDRALEVRLTQLFSALPPEWSMRGRDSPFDGYVVTGGFTGLHLCRALEGLRLEVVGESEPGIVRGLLTRQQESRSVPMILKAGGFGDASALTRCLSLE